MFVWTLELNDFTNFNWSMLLLSVCWQGNVDVRDSSCAVHNNCVFLWRHHFALLQILVSETPSKVDDLFRSVQLEADHCFCKSPSCILQFSVLIYHKNDSKLWEVTCHGPPRFYNALVNVHIALNSLPCLRFLATRVILFIVFPQLYYVCLLWFLNLQYTSHMRNLFCSNGTYFSFSLWFIDWHWCKYATITVLFIYKHGSYAVNML